VASALKGRSGNVTLKIYTSGPIYRKIYAVWKEKVRSIVGSALGRNALSALNREVCARSHITTPISHGATENALT
jgi:hypothetical protein